jgi:hypothetical protein
VDRPPPAWKVESGVVSRSGSERPAEIRPAFLPGILGAVVAFAGTGLIGSDFYIVIRFAISILALIMAVYAVQGRRWVFVVPLAALAVVWNPVVAFDFSGPPWLLAHIAAAAVFLLVGFLLKVPDAEPDRPRR